VEYIVTVPAIWTDMTKALTKACAIEAGLGSADGTIEMIREPEAAGLHALQSGIGLTLQAGETFVLCDAGGG
jgi:molecular chaperone DnaK (HSP70)